MNKFCYESVFSGGLRWASWKGYLTLIGVMTHWLKTTALDS